MLIDEDIELVIDTQNMGIEINNESIKNKKENIKYYEQSNRDLEELMNDLTDGNVIKTLHQWIHCQEGVIKALLQDISVLEDDTELREGTKNIMFRYKK
jgi:hypothetical protein